MERYCKERRTNYRRILEVLEQFIESSSKYSKLIYIESVQRKIVCEFVHCT